MRFDAFIYNIDIGAVEPVEEHHRISPGCFQPFDNTDDVGEHRADFYRHRYAHVLLDFRDDFDIGVFDFLAGDVLIKGDDGDIEFQTIDPGFFKLGCKSRPLIGRITMDTANDRDMRFAFLAARIKPKYS